MPHRCHSNSAIVLLPQLPQPPPKHLLGCERSSELCEVVQREAALGACSQERGCLRRQGGAGQGDLKLSSSGS